MVDKTMRKIVSNFDCQCRLYGSMFQLSREQLDLLEKGGKNFNYGELHDLLAKRQGLMEDIRCLNEKNRELQQEVNCELDIDEFVLSKIRGKIDEERYRELETVVLNLEKLLKSINEIDEKNLCLMRQLMIP